MTIDTVETDTLGEEMWSVARRLGHSRDDLTRMERAATSRKMLSIRLTRELSRAQDRWEREDREKWAQSTAEAARERDTHNRAEAIAERKSTRERLTLNVRVGRLLSEAASRSENTRAAALERSSPSAEHGAPFVGEETVEDKVTPILTTAIQAAEAILDAEVNGVPKLTGKDLEKAILETVTCPALVSLQFDVTPSYVEKLRRLHGRRAGDGAPREVTN
jgi:hypothetical protein